MHPLHSIVLDTAFRLRCHSFFLEKMTFCLFDSVYNGTLRVLLEVLLGQAHFVIMSILSRSDQLLVHAKFVVKRCVVSAQRIMFGWFGSFVCL